MARMANGAMRDALSLLDQCRSFEGTLNSAAILELLGWQAACKPLSSWSLFSGAAPRMRCCILTGSTGTVGILRPFCESFRIWAGIC